MVAAGPNARAAALRHMAVVVERIDTTDDVMTLLRQQAAATDESRAGHGYDNTH